MHTIDFSENLMIDLWVDKIYKFLEEKVALPVNDFLAKKLYFKALAQGAKLQNLRRHGIMNQDTIEIANSISDLTTSNYFSLSHPMITIPVIEAMDIHTKCARENPSIQMIGKLKQDLRGLQTLRDRYGIIRYRYTSLIENVEEFVSFQDNIMQKVGPMNIYNGGK